MTVLKLKLKLCILCVVVLVADKIVNIIRQLFHAYCVCFVVFVFFFFFLK